MGATSSKQVESASFDEPLNVEKLETASATEVMNNEKFESVSFIGVLSKKKASTVILSYLDRQSIVQLSLASKYIRDTTKIKLFSKMTLVPYSTAYESRTHRCGYPKIHRCGYLKACKENEVLFRDLLEKYHNTTQELTISLFCYDIWRQSYQRLINIRSLVLIDPEISQETMVKIICSFPMLTSLLIKDVFRSSRNEDSEIRIPDFPDNLINLQIFNSKAIFSYSIHKFFNMHSNLKYLRVEHEKLLERLLDPYPSLEHLVVRLSDQTQLLQPSFRNLVNLRTLDFLYPKLSYNMIESILRLPNLEDFKFNSRIEPFISDMKVKLCIKLKQLSIRSPISPEWTEFFINSCPNIESLKLVYSKSSLIFTKPEMFNQIKHLTIIQYSSEKFDLQELLHSQALESLELIVSRSIHNYSIKFFEKIDLASNWKFTIIDNRIVFYKLKQLDNRI